MFLGEPHITTRSFRQLSAKVGKEIFRDTDKMEPYYVAGFTLSRLEEGFKLKLLDPAWKPARYQLLLAVRFLLDGQPLPRLNSNEMARRCEDMIKLIWNGDTFGEIVDKAKNVLLEIAENKIPGGWDRDSIRTEPITQAIFEHFDVRYRGFTDAKAR